MKNYCQLFLQKSYFLLHNLLTFKITEKYLQLITDNVMYKLLETVFETGLQTNIYNFYSQNICRVCQTVPRKRIKASTLISFNTMQLNKRVVPELSRLSTA